MTAGTLSAVRELYVGIPAVAIRSVPIGQVYRRVSGWSSPQCGQSGQRRGPGERIQAAALFRGGSVMKRGRMSSTNAGSSVSAVSELVSMVSGTNRPKT